LCNCTLIQGNNQDEHGKWQYGGNADMIINTEAYNCPPLFLSKDKITQPPTFIGGQAMTERNIINDLFIFIESVARTLS
jgi:hypothetical protein